MKQYYNILIIIGCAIKVNWKWIESELIKILIISPKKKLILLNLLKWVEKWIESELKVNLIIKI